MVNEQKINDKITIGGLLAPGDADELKARGFSAVINLVTPDEPGYNEKHQVEDAGMDYASIPVAPPIVDDSTIERFIQQVESSEGPVAIHCKGGGRAGLMTLLYLSITHGWTLERAYEEGKKLDVKIGNDSPYREFFENAIKRHSAGEREQGS